MPLPVPYKELLAVAILCLPLPAQMPNQPETGAIAGTVVDTKGKTLSGIQITLSNEETGEQCKMTTDASGRYQLSHLRAGSYQLQFAGRDLRTETRTAVYACSSQTTHVDSKLAESTGPDAGAAESSGEIFYNSRRQRSPTQWIDGTVADVTGAVLPGAHVLAMGTDGNRYETTSQEDGRYRFSNLPTGSYCLNFQATGFAAQTVTVQTGQGPDVHLAPMLQGPDVRLAPMAMDMSDCRACPPLVEVAPPPAHAGISLEVDAQSSIVAVGTPFLLSVVLRNITDHPISIQLTDGSGPTLGYDVYALLHCGCPGKLQRKDFTDTRPDKNHVSAVSLLPGRTLTDRIDLSPLTNLNGPGKYWIFVERPDISSAGHGEEITNQPVIRSKTITVRVVPARVTEACK